MLEWTVKIRVADVWVADGYEATAERVKDALITQHGYCYDHEIEVELVSAPAPADVHKLQGSGTAPSDDEIREGVARALKRNRQAHRTACTSACGVSHPHPRLLYYANVAIGEIVPGDHKDVGPPQPGKWLARYFRDAAGVEERLFDTETDACEWIYNRRNARESEDT